MGKCIAGQASAVCAALLLYSMGDMSTDKRETDQHATTLPLDKLKKEF
jgi:hypothetical protein